MALRMVWRSAVGFALAAGLIPQLNAQSVRGPESEMSVPFDLVTGFEIVVHGRIGDLDRLRFIVDTGSSYSVLDRSVADHLGLDRRSASVFNFDRNVTVDRAAVPELRIGAFRVARMEMLVTSLADLSEFARDADGIIGMDVLSRARSLSIDYQRRRISLDFIEGRPNQTAAMNSFVVPVAIQGASMRLQVDTGMQYLMLYKDRLRDALPHLRIQGEPKSAALGRLPVTLVNLPGVQVVGRNAVTPALLIEDRAGTAVGELDGYLGPASLHARRIELDFAARTLRWE